MATLSIAMQSIALTVDDLRLLAYVQHMAQTAQSGAARRMFQEYMELEKQRIAGNGGPGARALPKRQAASRVA